MSEYCPGTVVMVEPKGVPLVAKDRPYLIIGRIRGGYVCTKLTTKQRGDSDIEVFVKATDDNGLKLDSYVLPLSIWTFSTVSITRAVASVSTPILNEVREKALRELLPSLGQGWQAT